MNLQVAAQRIQADLEAIKAFTATPGQGCTRMPYTKQTRQAADYLKDRMAQAGLEVHEDCVGNIFGVLPGAVRELPCIMVGSHYDSVYNGGDYDGIAGVICAVEIARQLQAGGLRLQADYVAAAFMDEEGCRFGNGYFGSRCMLGQPDVQDCLQDTDKDGTSLYQAMQAYGLAPDRLSQAAWPSGRIGHFVEPHIEQGPVLDAAGVALGLVEGIVGIRRYMITVKGRADHAGTTPMHMRQDAVEIAAKVIGQIGDMARARKNETVATVGYIKAHPNAVNIVADAVSFSVDIRAKSETDMQAVVQQICAQLDKGVTAVHASYRMDTKLVAPPLRLNSPMLGLLERSCKDHGYSYHRMHSGAGHDALAIGQHVDTAMLFVPSKDGRSHCPQEYTSCHAFAQAVQVLLDLICQL